MKKPKPTKKIYTSVQATPETQAAVDRLKRITNLSKFAIVQDAIRLYVETKFPDRAREIFP